MKDKIPISSIDGKPMPEEAVKGLTDAIVDVKEGRYRVVSNDPHKDDPKKVCDFLGDGKCNSKYGKNMKCDGVHTPKKCPWKNGGSYAMAVHDQANRRKK